MGQKLRYMDLSGQLAYARWLIDHGANLLQNFPGCKPIRRPMKTKHQRPPELRAIHSVACAMSKYESDTIKVPKALVQSEFFCSIWISEVSDGCICACPDQGYARVESS